MEERAAPLSLASHSLRGEGDHEVVAGYKTHRPQGDTTNPLNPPAKGRQNPLNPLNPQKPGHRVAHTSAPFRLAALATHPRKGVGR